MGHRSADAPGTGHTGRVQQRERTTAAGAPARHRDLVVAGVVLVWIPLALLAERGAGSARELVLGVGTWLLLLALLAGQTPLVRAQTAVVVGFATAVEYTFSPLLEVYVYRFGTVPAFVPPGHGLVYLAALCIGRSPWVRQRGRALVAATVVVGGAYALWGLSPLAPRLDVLGAFWFCCLLGFLRWGRSRLLYVGAFLVVTYLELIGTRLGTWAWQPYDPTGLVAMGNPPTGAAGGYGWFDLAAITAGPVVLATWRRLGRAGRGLTEPVDDGVVQPAVGGQRAAS